MSWEFLITSLIVVVMPGTGVVYTLAQGLGNGSRAALAAVVGCTLGVVPHMMASIFGLAAILHTSAVAFQALKLAGAAYLIYLAWMTLRERGGLDVQAERTRKSARRIAVQGFLINILNPKLSIFFLAFLPQFTPTDSTQPIMDMVGLSAVFMAMTAVVFAIYGVAASSLREHVLSRPGILAWMRRGFAATFGLLGVKLALSER